MGLYNLLGLGKEDKDVAETVVELEKQQSLVEILTLLKTGYEYHFKSKFDAIPMDSPLPEVARGDLVKCSHWLMDVHQSLGVKMHYLPLEEFETFLHTNDVCNYFLSVINQQDGSMTIEIPKYVYNNDYIDKMIKNSVRFTIEQSDNLPVVMEHDLSKEDYEYFNFLRDDLYNLSQNAVKNAVEIVFEIPSEEVDLTLPIEDYIKLREHGEEYVLSVLMIVLDMTESERFFDTDIILESLKSFDSFAFFVASFRAEIQFGKSIKQS